MEEFSNWLSGLALSDAIRARDWAIPTIQSVHIVGIGVVISSIFMIDLRVMGWGGPSQTLAQTTRRFAPWLWSALVVLVLTGSLLLIAEPHRQLFSLSFWIKMSFLLIGIIVAAIFQTSLRRNETYWEESAATRHRTKVLGIVTFLIWCVIIVMGRLIAYDAQVWGDLSPSFIS